MKKNTKWEIIDTLANKEEIEAIANKFIFSAIYEIIDDKAAKGLYADCNKLVAIVKDLGSDLSEGIMSFACINLKLEAPDQYDRVKMHIPSVYIKWIAGDSVFSDLMRINNEVRAKHGLEPKTQSSGTGENPSSSSNSSNAREEKLGNTDENMAAHQTNESESTEANIGNVLRPK